MTIKDEIVAIANQLANEGVTPTVAKVKAKLSGAAPLPTIINTLKSWQHQPDKTSFNDISEQDSTQAHQSEVEAAVSCAIKPLIEEINALKQRISILEKAKH